MSSGRAGEILPDHLAQCPYSASRETEASEERDLPETTSPTSDGYSVGARKSLLPLRESLGLFTGWHLSAGNSSGKLLSSVTIGIISHSCRWGRNWRYFRGCFELIPRVLPLGVLPLVHPGHWALVVQLPSYCIARHSGLSPPSDCLLPKAIFLVLAPCDVVTGNKCLLNEWTISEYIRVCLRWIGKQTSTFLMNKISGQSCRKSPESGN